MKKDLLSLLDLDASDFTWLFERALQLKKRFNQGISDRPLTGKSLGLIFDKKSTRTRVAFETAMIQLGGTPIYMSTQDTQISRNEPAEDTARVLSRYIDALAMRTFDHTLVEKFAASSTIPVINALTDSYHPCQILSDIMTIIEVKGGYENQRIVWVGDGNNVANSWVNAAAVLDLELIVATPEGYGIAPFIRESSLSRGGSKICFTNDPVEAVKGADVVYTDVWASMGQEEEQQSRISDFEGFQVNRQLLSHAKDDVMVMHCLPAHRGEEISVDILEAPGAVFWDQAENKRHMHKAILETLILRTNA
ncbi:Ornithine carbamoyltransferase [Desulfamplus magnetovallimortis]|uniref:Ornithine carbamoyltransferase n=1 Tax=Desulfamplus magnetovallimortis TaxID=1246637 RepID=A0A1W1HD18_9BACT|nr:ornithine carbamoyltransferase [Desulfamplus magnetovallimortis]SLM30336.1 Ornithine carbamoyltransferase [Desulfamplus magnetovallimortis]